MIHLLQHRTKLVQRSGPASALVRKGCSTIYNYNHHHHRPDRTSTQHDAAISATCVRAHHSPYKPNPQSMDICGQSKDIMRTEYGRSMDTSRTFCCSLYRNPQRSSSELVGFVLSVPYMWRCMYTWKLHWHFSNLHCVVVHSLRWW